TEWGSVVHGGSHRGGFRLDVPFPDWAWNRRARCVGSDTARAVVFDDPFPDTPACADLALHTYVVLDSRFFRAELVRRAKRKEPAIVDAPDTDAVVGERTRRLSDRVC